MYDVHVSDRRLLGWGTGLHSRGGRGFRLPDSLTNSPFPCPGSAPVHVATPSQLASSMECTHGGGDGCVVAPPLQINSGAAENTQPTLPFVRPSVCLSDLSLSLSARRSQASFTTHELNRTEQVDPVTPSVDWPQSSASASRDLLRADWLQTVQRTRSLCSEHARGTVHTGVRRELQFWAVYISILGTLTRNPILPLTVSLTPGPRY